MNLCQEIPMKKSQIIKEGNFTNYVFKKNSNSYYLHM